MLNAAGSSVTRSQIPTDEAELDAIEPPISDKGVQSGVTTAVASLVFSLGTWLFQVLLLLGADAQGPGLSRA